MRPTEFQYTKEDFGTSRPYEDMIAIDQPFEREVKIRALAEYAKGIGVNGFTRVFKAYVDSKKRANNTIYIDSYTNFSGQPIELICGGWKCDDLGVTRHNGVLGDETACCHPILPCERLVNIDTGAEKLRIAFSKGQKWRQIICDKKTLACANKITDLSETGIAVTSENARLLVRYLSELENLNYDRIPERKSVGRLGYIGDEGFSPYVDGLIFDGDAVFGNLFSAVKSHGQAQKWRETAIACRKMSTTVRIVLAASFASVLVEPMGCLPFFVHLWGGESGTGKTVALMLAASVWGDPQMGKLVQTFNATAVSQEKTAAFLNSLPMCIDELQMARDKTGRVQFNVYMLAQGAGKGRGNKNGGIDKTPTWHNCFLTTGESPITSSSDGAGALNRVIDIECRAGEKVITGGMHISSMLKRHYGSAGKAFVKKIQEPGVMDNVTERYQTLFRELSDSDATEKQAMAAALILVADELITKWIFRDGDPLSTTDISAFLQTKASVSAGERGYRYMCDWVAQNVNHMRPDVENGDVYGIVEGDTVYIIRKVFCETAERGGFSVAALLSYLKQNGLIITRKKNTSRGKRIGGVLTECIAMRLTVPEDVYDVDSDEGDITYI